MFFHFTIFFWSIVFFLGLEAIAVNPITLGWNWHIFSVVSLIIISLAASKRLTKRYADAFLPGLLSLTAPMLLLLIDHPTERQVFAVLSTLMYYFALLGIYRLRHAPADKTAKSFLYSAAMAAMFFFYAGAYGFYLNFDFPLWGLMLLYFLGTALTSYETFLGVEKREYRRMRLYSVLLGLVMGEMVWFMSFWPFGYLTTGAATLIFFFIIWDIALDGFRQKLSLKKTFFRLLFLLGLVALLLASSPWRILV